MNWRHRVAICLCAYSACGMVGYYFPVIEVQAWYAMGIIQGGAIWAK